MYVAWCAPTRVCVHLCAQARTSPRRRALVRANTHDHFDGNNELELALRSKGKNEMADMVKNILPEGVECVFVRQKDGTLAGADIHLSDAVRYMVNEVGISQDDAIRMASLIPAQVLGMESEIGCLVPDAQADFLWMKNDLEIEKVWVGGKEQS